MCDLKVLFLLFIAYSMIGWMIEVVATFPDTKCFVNRGFLIGPYCPIYGNCAIAMVLLLHNVKSPILLFILSIIICSVGEYITSYLMEKLFHARWWDYSHRKFNINGRVCLSNLVLFGIMGLVMIYLVNPFLINILNKIDIGVLKVIVSILVIIFMTDLFLSLSIISKIKNVGKTILKDSTEEISAKVKEVLLTKGKLTSRFAKAFPNFRVNVNSYMKKKKKKNKENN